MGTRKLARAQTDLSGVPSYGFEKFTLAPGVVTELAPARPGYQAVLHYLFIEPEASVSVSGTFNIRSGASEDIHEWDWSTGANKTEISGCHLGICATQVGEALSIRVNTGTPTLNTTFVYQYVRA